MVYNGYEYLSEFLSHHLALCDSIYIIDHNSDVDLRQAGIERVTVVRSSHEAQFQSECTNTVLEHFDIRKNYDWLFVLDIDEFLPFSDRGVFHDFLKKHEQDRVLQFHWRNGVPFYDDRHESPASLIDCNSIRFFNKRGQQYKSFVNIKKTKGNFFVPTGSHHIVRAFFPGLYRLPFLKNRKHYQAVVSDLPLYHIIAFNKTAFIKKIKNYVEQMKYREHIKGQGGWLVRDYPDALSDDQWLWYIANFRVGDREQFYDVAPEDFIEEPVFSHLDRSQVMAFRSKIAACAKMNKKKAGQEEQDYLRFKQDDRNIADNIKWFGINSENEIQTIIPGSRT